MNNPKPENKLKDILTQRSQAINNYLSNYLHQDAPDHLKEAILYSLLAGGKRLRPVLCLSWSILSGGNITKSIPFAAAIEMIHTYSLIHDDLPAMDNDDFRRGRPASHKAFDEATAILAGDGLLTDAFYIALQTSCEPHILIRATQELALAAGSAGMVGGQILDMKYTGKKLTAIEPLIEMQALKTGAMLRASCLCGAIIGGASGHLCNMAADYGAALGKAFQIMDDILDETGDPKAMGKPVKSDQTQGKLTWPSIIGIEASKKEATRQVEIAINALKDIENPEKAFLTDLALYVLSRSA